MMPGEYVTIEDLKKQGYGIFNGMPMGLHYNREQKRRYVKKYKHDKEASYCHWCNAKTLTILDDYNDCICELCGIVKTRENDHYKAELEALKELEDLTEDDIPWLRGEGEDGENR